MLAKDVSKVSFLRGDSGPDFTLTWTSRIFLLARTCMWLLTCFLVRIFPVRILMYLAISSFLPYIFPSSDRIIFLRPQGGYICKASVKQVSISGDQTPSASSSSSFISLSSSNCKFSVPALPVIVSTVCPGCKIKLLV